MVTKNVVVSEGASFSRSQRMTGGGDLKYAISTNMTTAMLKNANGKFVAPSPAGATAAATQNASVSASN